MVLWKTLSLVGFGRYREGVEISLAPGINTCITGNEGGKSTLVAGLIAVIFGLPQERSQDRFGIDRYKNWHGPRNFQGQVIFHAQGEDYRIIRNFETHDISLSKFQNGQWQVQVLGEHNPRARRRNIRYEEKIEELLGIWSQELFTSVFCVEQPFPRSSQLDGEVQRLLSGAGDLSYAQGLARLKEEALRLTRRTGDLGITPRNALKDGAIEILEMEISVLESDISRAQEITCGLGELYEVLASLEEERKAKRALLTSKRSLQEAWDTWRTLVRDWKNGLEEYKMLKNVTEKSKETIDLIRERISELDQSYPEFNHLLGVKDEGSTFVTLPSDDGKLSKALYHLDDLTRKWDTLSREMGSVQEKLKELNEERRELIEALPRYSHVLDRPGLIAEHNELLECSREIKRIKGFLKDDQGRDVLELVHDRLRLIEELEDLEEEAISLELETRRPYFISTLVGVLIGSGLGVGAFMAGTASRIIAILGAAGGVLGWLWDQVLSTKKKRRLIRELKLRSEVIEDVLLEEEEKFPLPRDSVELRTTCSALELDSKRLLELEGARAVLLRGVAPFDEGTTNQELQALLTAGLELNERLEEVETELRFSTLKLKRLEQELVGTESEIGELRKGLDDVLMATGGDIGQALARWEGWNGYHEELLLSVNSLNSLLCGWQVSDSDELEERLLSLEMKLHSIRRDIQGLTEQHPSLPELDEALDISKVESAFAHLKGEVESLISSIDSLDEEILKLRKEQAMLEGGTLVNIAVAQDSLLQKRTELARLEEKAQALGLAHRYLTESVADFHATCRERLEYKATEYFQRLTAKERQVRLKEDFSVYLDDAGVTVVPSQLSQGAQDLLYLSIRFAIADLISCDVQLPFIFDDPFLNVDSHRLDEIRKALEELAQERQILLFSHREEFSQWGTFQVELLENNVDFFQ